jgi:hypothetical protein
MMLNQNDQQIRNWVDATLQTTKDGLKKYVFNAYKNKYPSSYMGEIQEKLKDQLDNYPDDIFRSDDLFLSKLEDPKAWLDLMSRRWNDLFQSKSGTAGKRHVESLRDLRNKWAHQHPISLQEAISGVEAAINLLKDFKCDECLIEMRKIQVVLENILAPPTPGFLIQADNHKLTNIPLSETIKLLDGDTELFQPIRETNELQLEVIEQGGGLRNLKVPVHIARVIVGRGGTAHVLLNDSKVSRVHLMLTQSSKPGLVLTDLRSANGTLLEGRRLLPNEPTQWRIGQVITLGSTWIILRRGCE